MVDGSVTQWQFTVHRSLFAVCSFFARSLHDYIAPILPARNASRSDAGGHHTAHQHLDDRNPGMTLSELQEIYTQPFFDLISQARSVYLECWPRDEVQLCTLLSIKTGGCSEDCGYCAQSARYSTGVEAGRLMQTEEVMKVAERAKENGSTRFCMGAAWKGVREGDAKFEKVLDIIQNVSRLGMEVCVTLGHLGLSEAKKLKAAGVTAYNHNLDTSEEFYPEIVSTHTFQDRLDTIKAVQSAGISVCCGGIIGMGETETDRLKMLGVLTNFDPAPESVPINCLIPMPGTPLEAQPPVDIFELVRLVATTRIVLPKTRVRLSAGRTRLSREAQALCFFAGANSVFYGKKLLTAANPGVDEDRELLSTLDLATGENDK
jgi:biotin synthase